MSQDSAENPPTDALFQEVYTHLRAIAGQHLGGAAARGTLTPTGLVHEAYLRLAGRSAAWASREHFISTAAQAMRQIVLNYARDKGRLKRGGGRTRVSLDGDGPAVIPLDDGLLDLDDALTRLAAHDPQAARVVLLRYFGGSDWAEIAAALDTSPDEIKHSWEFARAWLHRHLAPR
ncbi:ECF-type sigma factor [Gemmata massiliana]|nr:ECF-type sigma factor [Gemmata massiliana]